MELAAVGVSIAVFNQVSKVAIFPLVSVTTSFVAEEDATERLNTEADDNEIGADHNGVINKGYALLNQEIEMAEQLPLVGVLFLFFPFLFLFEYMLKIIAILGVPIYLKFFFFLPCEVSGLFCCLLTCYGFCLILQPESMHKSYRKTNDRRHNPSASTALVIASLLGLIQALFLIFSAKPILNYMGIDSVSFLLLVLEPLDFYASRFSKPVCF